MTTLLEADDGKAAVPFAVFKIVSSLTLIHYESVANE
jgi:hypothetical protein